MRASAALLGFARAARERPQAVEVMHWELVEDNALTRRLAELRLERAAALLVRAAYDRLLPR